MIEYSSDLKVATEDSSNITVVGLVATASALQSVLQVGDPSLEVCIPNYKKILKFLTSPVNLMMDILPHTYLCANIIMFLVLVSRPGGGGGSLAHKLATHPRPNGVSHHVTFPP